MRFIPKQPSNFVWVELVVRIAILGYPFQLMSASVKSIKPLIGIVENIRRELSWGMAFSRSSLVETTLQDKTVAAFRVPTLELGHAILNSMEVTQQVLIEVFQRTTWARRSFCPEKDAVNAAQEQLLRARKIARTELRKIADSHMEQRTSTGEVQFPPEFFNFCLFMISLMQVGKAIMPMFLFSYWCHRWPTRCTNRYRYPTT